MGFGQNISTYSTSRGNKAIDFFANYVLCLMKNSVSLQKKMKYDLSESISQRSSGEKDAENHRIKEISNELRRRCQLYEAESGDSKIHVNRLLFHP